MKQIAWIVTTLIVVAVVTVSADPMVPAPVAADAGIPDAVAASHPCATGLMGTCHDMENATCVLFDPNGHSPPYVQDGACDGSDDDCP